MKSGHSFPLVSRGAPAGMLRQACELLLPGALRLPGRADLGCAHGLRHTVENR